MTETRTPSAVSAPDDVPRVAILGAHGRMGRHAVPAVRAAEGLELVAELGSQDRLDAVLDAGATHVRVGSAIFGTRAPADAGQG